MTVPNIYNLDDQLIPSGNQISTRDIETEIVDSRKLNKEPLENENGTIVVKIGGSTLGEHDTTLRDLVSLQRTGINPIVVHGGGKIISEWMKKQGIKPRFINGLRVTDADSLNIAVSVLSGLINKQLVASLLAMGGKAIGLSGADGGMLMAKLKDRELGFVGDITDVNTKPIEIVLDIGYIPIIAPIAIPDNTVRNLDSSLLNVNADTAAGYIAAAIKVKQLVFLTDVEGVMDSSRRLIPRLTERQALGLIHSNVAAGGMIPKLEACLKAFQTGSISKIIDGRRPSALMDTLSGKASGTRIG